MKSDNPKEPNIFPNRNYFKFLTQKVFQNQKKKDGEKNRKMKNINSGASVPQGRRAFSMAVLDSLATATKKQIESNDCPLAREWVKPKFFLNQIVWWKLFFFDLG